MCFFLAVGLSTVIDWAGYSWLPGCDLYDEASALEQIVPCGRGYRICTDILAAETKSWLKYVHGSAHVHLDKFTQMQVHVHTHTPWNHFWLVKIRDIQHSLVNVCLCSLARKRTLCECVFTSQLQCCELYFTASRWIFSMWTCTPQRWKYT